MLTFSDQVIRDKLHADLHQNADHIAFLSFSNVRQSVLDDLKILEDHPLVLNVPITGYIYDVKTGRIERVGRNA